jgi:hypothetical protein
VVQLNSPAPLVVNTLPLLPSVLGHFIPFSCKRPVPFLLISKLEFVEIALILLLFNTPSLSITVAILVKPSLLVVANAISPGTILVAPLLIGLPATLTVIAADGPEAKFSP